MAKNIVICCDGTGNGFDQPETDSNVVKLYNTLHIDPTQIAYYHPGVGTLGSPNADGRLAKLWSQAKGLAFGAGLLDNVGDAYRYLMNTYQKGDRIFLFGFSRGAYTARAVGGLLHVFGLLEPGNEQLIPYILRLYSARTRDAAAAQDTTTPAEDAFAYAFSRDVMVHFCGVWDTVSSYGWIYSPIELRFAAQNPIIQTGRHAIAIHERRCCYQSQPWGAPLPNQDLRQVWFCGVHSDVGGSYLETEGQLSKITFEWMLLEAIKAGLKVEPDRVAIVLGDSPPPKFLPAYVKPDPKGCIHNSLDGPWWILEYLPRKRNNQWCLPRGTWTRQIPENAVIHATVPLSGRAVALPAAYSVETWTRYQPPPPTVAEQAFAFTDRDEDEAPSASPTMRRRTRQ